MMFRWTIKQPGIQKFWNSCDLYQDSYDWISPLNKHSGILTQQSMGRNEYGISCHSHIFAFYEARNGAFEGQFFSGLHFYTLSKTLIACRNMKLRFLKVKTLLNDAFNPWETTQRHAHGKNTFVFSAIEGGVDSVNNRMLYTSKFDHTYHNHLFDR